MTDGFKTCCGCKELRPFDEFRPFRHGAFGLRAKCKECEKTLRHENIEAARRNPKTHEGEKVCRVCKELKSRTQFRINCQNKDRLDTACIECSDGNRRSAYQKNPLPHMLSVKKWRENNPEHNREISYRGSAKFKKDNPLICAAWAHAGYAMKTGRLVKTPCEICGNPEVEAHHMSHKQEHWLHVQFLCEKHHGRANKIKGDWKYYTKELDEINEARLKPK